MKLVDKAMKVLVPVDGSKNSIEGLQEDVEHVRHRAGKIILINVQPDGVDSMVEHRDQDTLGKIADRILEKAEKIILPSGVKYEKVVEFGQPANAIIEYADKEKIDVIIVGSRGLTGIKRFLLGSVASRLVTYAHCNVMVIK
jgi:nucleotide-binding universal stress UspA family protein